MSKKKKKKYTFKMTRVFTILGIFILIIAIIILLSVKSENNTGTSAEASSSPSFTDFVLPSSTPQPVATESPAPTPSDSPIPTESPTPTPTLPALTIPPITTPIPAATSTPTPSLKKDPNALKKPSKKMISNAATGKVSSKGVNLRQGPSATTPIVVSGLAKNTELTIYPTEDKDFYFVKVNETGKYGYISKKYVKPTSAFGSTAEPSAGPAPKGSVLGTVTASKIALRAEASQESKTIREFSNKPKVYVFYKSNGYYYVQVAGTKYEGFMSAKFIKVSDPVPSK